MVRAFGVSRLTMRKRMALCILSLLLCIGFTALADQTSTSNPQQTDKSPLVELGDEYHNSIKLLQNRFRIDYEVDEITMVFFRSYGSAPVVLVRPDGSKIFQTQADGEEVFWFDAATYDLINIKNPTPGPWQAVGQILPDSRVMVISDIQLIADPLPDVIFSGEILKQTARLSNGGEPINNAEFRDVVSLDIRLVSTNNPNYNNFGAEVQTIATFEDNGRGMDERPLDGVFTGQFNLAVPDGEWTPVFVVSTPMLTREQVDPPLMLYPNPIKVTMEEDGGGDGYHKLVIDAEREHVDINTLLIDGKVRFPNGDVQNFSLTEQSPNAREHLIVNYEAGVYRVKLTAYGNTVSGRDFILDVPESTFLVEEPEPEIVAADMLPPTDNTNDVAIASKIPSDSMNITEESAVEKEDDSMLGLIVGVNLAIFIVGAVAIWFLVTPKQNRKLLSKKESVNSQSFFSKIKAKLSFGSKSENKSKDPDTKKSTTDDDSDMLDLSLPKE